MYIFPFFSVGYLFLCILVIMALWIQVLSFLQGLFNFFRKGIECRKL